MKRQNMMLTRPPIARMQLIITRIASGRFPNQFSLAEELECTVKTVGRDIDFLRDRLGHDIEYIGDHWGYAYRSAPKPLLFVPKDVAIHQATTEADVNTEPVDAAHYHSKRGLDQKKRTANLD